VLAWIGAGALVVGVGVGAFFLARAIGAAARGDPPRETPTTAEPPTNVTREAARGTARELSIVSEPPGATVHVNGTMRNARTPTVVALEGDAHAVWVRVGLDGFVTEEREVLASAGEARFVLHPLDPGQDAASEDGGSDRPDPTKRRRRPRRR
jgi:hypothetical protein